MLCEAVRWVAFFAFISLFDVPTARLHYLSLLSTHVTPTKERLLQEYHSGACQAEVDDTLYCRTVCDAVGDLCRVRQAILETTREAHPLGRLMAEAFDWRRNITQDRKVEALRGRQCLRKLLSVDRANGTASVHAVSYAVVSFLGAFLLFHGWGQNRLASHPTLNVVIALSGLTALALKSSFAMAWQPVLLAVTCTSAFLTRR
eukprot:GGOE01049349.1.p1 GENE.GGOE01049349.1~~GGOE01049349.1.p1  ORF type:complete len:203 (-),score=49.33 GGOE01049349.1:37-645(-)